jgi:hypothetical protein
MTVLKRKLLQTSFQLLDAFRVLFTDMSKISKYNLKTTDDFPKAVERFYRATKTMHFLAFAAIPLIILIVFGILPLTGSIPNQIEELGMVLFFLYPGFVLGLTSGMMGPKIFEVIFGLKRETDSLLAVYKLFKYHVAILFVFILQTALFTYIIWILGGSWYSVLPILAMSVLANIFTFPTPRRWEKWRTGY